MKRFLFLMYIICSAGLYTSAFNKITIAKSDSLFAKGVELYNLKKYNEAIPLFEESDKIDKAELDSLNNRRNYSSMWLASCYYQLGDTAKAEGIDSILFCVPPIDRRLTVQSDSLKALIPNITDFSNKIIVSKKAYDIESKIIGRSHPASINSLLDIAILYCLTNDVKNAYHCFNDIFLDYHHIDNKYCLDEQSLKILFSFILQNSSQIGRIEILQDLDRMIELSSYSKNDSNGTVWGQLISLKGEFLMNSGKTDDYYCLILDAYNDISNSECPNFNKFEIYSQMANALYYQEKSASDFRSREESCKRRKDIYDEMLAISEYIWGKNSCEYGGVLVKIANLHLGTGMSINRDEGRYLILQAFNFIINDESLPFKADLITSIVKGSYISFDVANENISYISYLKKIIERISSLNPFVDLVELQSYLAHALLYNHDSSTLDDITESISLYTDIINIKHERNEDISTYLKERAYAYSKRKDYHRALADYLKVDSIIESDHKIYSFIECSNNNEIEKHISDLYFQLFDTTKSHLYWEKYCTKEESLIANIISGKYPNSSLFDPYKFEIIKDYAFQFLNLPGTIHFDLDKAITYANINISLIPSLQVSNQFKEDYKFDMLQFLSVCYLIKQDFKNGYQITTELLENARKTNNTRYLISGHQKLSQLYEWVSIEPELALSHKLCACELLSDELISSHNKMLKEEYITSHEMIYQDWNKCAELCSYLGDRNKADECYSKFFYYTELLDGKDSERYAELRFNWYANFKIPQCFSRDLSLRELGLAYCDSLARYYSSNPHLFKNLKYYDAQAIGNLYSCFGDSVNLNKFYRIHLDNLKKEYPLDYKSRPEYLRFLKDYVERLYLHDNIAKLSELKKLEPIFEEFKDTNQNEYIDLLTSIASGLHVSKDYEQENVYLDKILSLKYDKSMLQNLVICYIELEKYDQIIPLFDLLSKYSKEKIIKEIKNLPSSQREYVWKKYVDVPFSIGECLAEAYPDIIDARTLYDNLLLRKNFLLNTSISSINFIREEGDTLLLAKYDRLQRLQKFLESDKDTLLDMNHTISREQAEKLVSRFKDEIMRRAGILGDYTSALICSWKEVQEIMTADDVAIEFSKYIDIEGKTSYAAVILTSQNGPIFRPLFKEEDLLNILDLGIYSGDAGYNLVWRPIMKYIDGKKRIIFSPDGLLYSLSIENFVDNADVRISHAYEVYRVSSTRELLVNHYRPLSKYITLYGGLNYGADVKVLAKDTQKYPSSLSNNRDFNFSNIADSLNLRSGVGELPATKTEVENIRGFLNRLKIPSELFTADEGTEASFKNLSGRPMQIIHIATHGFYWTEKEARKLDLKFLVSNINNFEDKSLSRSGLLLTGANNALMGHPIPTDVEDGILTAREISSLDLRGLDMVVLSACQTGLGEITGDGVFGLQRGFKKAGANTILMSLWKVDDRATQLLMTKFYENFLSGKSKLESLNLAQKYVMEYEEEIEMEDEITQESYDLTPSQKRRLQSQEGSKIYTKKKIRPFEDPKYWAAFILLDALN